MAKAALSAYRAKRDFSKTEEPSGQTRVAPSPRPRFVVQKHAARQLDYGDFEGTIPKGEYGGGTVQLWDRGYWAPEGGRTPQEAFDSGDLKFTLDGGRLHGSWVAVRMRTDRYGGQRTNWLLIKHPEADAKPGQ